MFLLVENYKQKPIFKKGIFNIIAANKYRNEAGQLLERREVIFSLLKKEYLYKASGLGNTRLLCAYASLFPKDLLIVVPDEKNGETVMIFTDNLENLTSQKKFFIYGSAISKQNTD